MLCRVCYRMFRYHDGRIDDTVQTAHFKHHSNRASFEEAALKHCTICRELWHDLQTTTTLQESAELLASPDSFTVCRIRISKVSCEMTARFHLDYLARFPRQTETFVAQQDFLTAFAFVTCSKSWRLCRKDSSDFYKPQNKC